MSAAEATDGRGPWRTYVCVVCGFIYDEAAGWPAEGIAPGTRWSDVPDWWTCPDCGVGKADFDMLEA
jgi:rubredoxin